MGKGGGAPKETAEEVELKRIAVEKWNDHQNRLLPFENKYIEDATRNPEGSKARAAGQVNADVMQSAGALVVPPGTNPANGGATVPAGVPALANTMAKTQVNAGQNIEDNRVKALQSVVNMGQGKSAQAMEGFETAATGAVNKAVTDAQTSAQNRRAIGGAVMSALGAGAAIAKNTYNTESATASLNKDVANVVNPMAKYNALPSTPWSNFGTPVATYGPKVNA